jgi:hypothetical protein|tara:strand:- start:216 stop:476 length:261 start_codon:yes stop_codon:yes gene_type:complete
MSEREKLKVGDLVFYRPSEENRYADGEKQMGIILQVFEEANPLFVLRTETEMFADEYLIKWIKSGYTSTLMAFNLKKIEIPLDKEE